MKQVGDDAVQANHLTTLDRDAGLVSAQPLTMLSQPTADALDDEANKYVSCLDSPAGAVVPRDRSCAGSQHRHLLLTAARETDFPTRGCGPAVVQDGSRDTDKARSELSVVKPAAKAVTVENAVCNTATECPLLVSRAASNNSDPSHNADNRDMDHTCISGDADTVDACRVSAAEDTQGVDLIAKSPIILSAGAKDQGEDRTPLSSLGRHAAFSSKHTHTHTFNGPFSRTTQVSRYQKGKTSLDFTEARDSERQWNPLGHMQVCISFQTRNHASTQPLCFLQAGCPPCCPTNRVDVETVCLSTARINLVSCKRLLRYF